MLCRMLCRCNISIHFAMRSGQFAREVKGVGRIVVFHQLGMRKAGVQFSLASMFQLWCVYIFITICFSRLTTSWLTPWLEGAGNSRRRTHRGSADWPSAHALAGGALHERQGANRWPPGLRASKQQCYSLLLHINVACSSCFLLPRNHCFDPRCGVVLIDDCCCHGVHAHKQTKSDPLGDQILDYILDKCAFY